MAARSSYIATDVPIAQIPDLTTAGDWCRRLTGGGVRTLLGIFDDIRVRPDVSCRIV